MIKTKGTKEWCNASFNIMQGGCVHGCVYCYARRLEHRFKRDTFGYQIKNKLGYVPSGCHVMFPTTHDIDLAHLDLFARTLAALILQRNTILLVTKSDSQIISDLLKLTKQELGENLLGNIEIRPSITTKNNEIIEKYEKKTATYEERLDVLRIAEIFGCQRSVSIEPLLCSPDELNEITKEVWQSHTVSIWIGALSFIPKEMKEFTSKIYTISNFEQIYIKYRESPMVLFKDTFINRYNLMRKKEMSKCRTLDQFGGKKHDGKQR